MGHDPIDRTRCQNYRDCDEPIYRDGPMCKKHGCVRCGGIILADSDDGPELLCYDHWMLPRVTEEQTIALTQEHAVLQGETDSMSKLLDDLGIG